MEGCSAPLVVKFADTQKEKDAKRVQSIQTNLWNFATGLNSPMTPSPVPVASPIHSNPPAHTSPYMASEALPATSLQLLQQIQAFGLQQQLLHGELPCHPLRFDASYLWWVFKLGLGAQAEPQAQQATAASLSAAAAAGLLGPISVQNLLTLAAMSQPTLTGATASQQSPLHNGNAANLCKFLPPQQLMTSLFSIWRLLLCRAWSWCTNFTTGCNSNDTVVSGNTSAIRFTVHRVASRQPGIGTSCRSSRWQTSGRTWRL